MHHTVLVEIGRREATTPRPEGVLMEKQPKDEHALERLLLVGFSPLLHRCFAHYPGFGSLRKLSGFDEWSTNSSSLWTLTGKRLA